jgi:hypothetical protein
VDDRVVRRREGRIGRAKMVGPHLEGDLEGLWEWRLGGEALLELSFFTKPPNFGVGTHMEVFAGVALIVSG